MLKNNIKFLLASFTFVCLLFLEGINANATEENNDSNQVLVEDQQPDNGDSTQDSFTEQQLENGNSTQVLPAEQQLEVGSSTIALQTNQQSEDVTTDDSENELSTESTQIQSDSWKKDANEPLDDAVPVIYKYEIDGDGYIVPGEEFTLKFTIYNPAVVTKLGSINLSISQDESLVYPQYKNTNSVFIGYLLPLSYAEGELKLKASDYITTDQIIINITLFYTDNYSTNNRQQLTAVLPVSPGGKLSISSVDVPSNVYVGANNRLRVSYQNSGLSSINDVVLHMTGNTIDEQDISLGTIGSGSNMSSDVYLPFTEDGEQSINLYFTYTDNNGKSYETDNYKYSFDVKEYDESSSQNANPNNSRITINSLLTIFMLLGSLILVSSYFAFVFLKRKSDDALLKGEKNEIQKDN